MKMWISEKECTGCGACSNVCPRNAITMIEDISGFEHPKIDQDKCINCALCKKTCPILSKIDTKKMENLDVYACWSKNEDTRYTSTSGGLFTEIAQKIISLDGYVAGASYNDDNMVEHIIVNNINDLEKLKQSKYLQSDTKDIYIKIRDLLNQNKLVAFCGSPCQVAGLNTFLKKKYSNLLTIEFICRGMNSPKAYRSWLSEIELKENKKVIRVWFKYKINGWKSSPKCTRVDFQDGSYKVYYNQDNLYMRGYLESNLYIRPSCGNCKFNGIYRQADITLADFWGISEELDDDKGTSLVLINTINGKNYFDKIKDNIVYKKRTIGEIYSSNMCFTTSVEINKKSKKFLSKLDKNNFTKLYLKYSKESFFKKGLKKIKKVLKFSNKN